MTKKNITITALAAVLVMAMSAMAIAGPGYGKRNGCTNNPAFTQLTPEKQAAVDKIVESYSEKFSELRTAMWTKHSTLQAMVNGGNADEKKIGKLTAEITDLRDKMWDLREKMAADLEKETGIANFALRGQGRGACSGSVQGCSNYGSGFRGKGRMAQPTM